MTAEPAVSAQNLSKRFRVRRERRTSIKERLVRGRAPGSEDFWALRDVTFDIPQGSFFGIVGHNGSGKSTVLKVLAGIYRPTAGHVEVNGRVSALLELGAGFHPELTGRENIRLNGTLLGLTRAQIDRSTDEIVEFAGIDEFIDAPVKVYSSGMSIRLGFAIAVQADPEILIVDEVISVGDEEFQRKCSDHLFRLRNRGATIILVSHSMASVESICDHALWLDHGRVAARGRSHEVVQSYVDHVNRKEHDSSGEPEPDDLSLSGVRIGSGEIRVVDLQILDGSGNERGFAVAGEPAVVRMVYEAKEDLAAVDFGLGFIHESGAYVAGPNSRPVGPFDVTRGTGFVDFVMDDVLLEPGAYWLSTAAVRGDYMYDHLDRGFAMKVRGTPRGGAGLVGLPGGWRQPTATAGPPLDRSGERRGTGWSDTGSSPPLRH